MFWIVTPHVKSRRATDRAAARYGPYPQFVCQCPHSSSATKPLSCTRHTTTHAGRVSQTARYGPYLQFVCQCPHSSCATKPLSCTRHTTTHAGRASQTASNQKHGSSFVPVKLIAFALKRQSTAVSSETRKLHFTRQLQYLSDLRISGDNFICLGMKY